MSPRLSTRRQFLTRGTGLLMGLITLMLSIPAIGFLLSPLFTGTRESWVKVGPVDDIPVDTPTAMEVSVPLGEGFPVPDVRRIVYVVRRKDGTVLALSNICSHMQCDVHWDKRLSQFLCPCHGGLYDIKGTNIGGPPPRPLPQWVHRFSADPGGHRILEIANRLQDPI
jgi:menaquinol-cytochrome c reductase iron-sulfur subunit